MRTRETSLAGAPRTAGGRAPEQDAGRQWGRKTLAPAGKVTGRRPKGPGGPGKAEEMKVSGGELSKLGGDSEKAAQGRKGSG